MKVSARVSKGRIVFASQLTESVFLEKCEGKDLIIAVDDETTGEKRRFFEGGVVPVYFYLHPFAGWRNFKECREAIKLEFIPGFTKSRDGKQIVYPRSTTELSNRAFGEFLEKVTGYLRENFGEIIDSDEYKAWRDSAPVPGSIFPQHARLKTAWESARLST